MQEAEIIELIRSRNEKGIDVFLRYYGPFIRYIVTPMIGNKQNLDDCVSEVAMFVWDKITLYDNRKRTWKEWLTAIARNTAMKKINCEQENHSTMSNTGLPSAEQSTAKIPIDIESQYALRKAIKQLAYKDKILFYRKYYYLQSTTQIASELGMSERVVKKKLKHIKIILRNLLGGEFE